MTMTDSPPAANTALAATSPRVVGLFDTLTTTDHKRIGRLWLRSGLLGLLAATLIGVVLAIENSNSSPDDIFGGVNSYFQYFSLYRFGLVLLVVAPLFVGLATVVVPMQVGATNVAFPRAAHGAAWLFMIGAGITFVSVVSGGGWGALDGITGTERDAIALTLVGTGLVIVSLLVASGLYCHDGCVAAHTGHELAASSVVCLVNAGRDQCLVVDLAGCARQSRRRLF